MASWNAILYLDTPANRETVCGCGLAFDPVEIFLQQDGATDPISRRMRCAGKVRSGNGGKELQLGKGDTAV